jgi:hypothetical protein
MGCDSEFPLLSRDQLTTTELMDELWRPIPGYGGLYEISTHARVKRRHYELNVTDHPHAKGLRVYEERILKLRINSDGYVCVSLGKYRRNIPVHILMLEAFVGPRPKGYIACHGANGKLDNSVANLSWGTYSKNLGADKRRDGTLPIGEKHHRAKLTDENVKFIRANHRHYSNTELARMFSVSRSAIYDVLTYRRWIHLD